MCIMNAIAFFRVTLWPHHIFYVKLRVTFGLDTVLLLFYSIFYYFYFIILFMFSIQRVPHVDILWTSFNFCKEVSLLNHIPLVFCIQAYNCTSTHPHFLSLQASITFAWFWGDRSFPVSIYLYRWVSIKGRWYLITCSSDTEQVFVYSFWVIQPYT